MENERHIADGLVDRLEGLKAQAFPVCRVDTVDIADAGCKEVNAEICDLLALLRICTLTLTDDAVLFAADCADLCLNGETELMCNVNELCGLLNVLVDREVRAVEHDRGEAGLNALVAAVIGAVIEVQSDRNGDAEGFIHCLDHCSNGLEAAHILSCAFGNTEDDRGVQLLRCEQNSLCPFEVVDVELTDSVLTVSCLVQHVFCRYQHC